MIDALRRFTPAFLQQHVPAASISSTLDLLLRCRTPALGGHRYECDNCGYSAVLYNSCGNRHCPQCQGARRHRWVEAQQELLLPVPHFQVVFTLPAELRPIAMAFPREIYNLLFQAAAVTLKKLAATHWDAVPAILAVLHTWTRELSYHPHVHCVVSAGGLTSDDEWVASSPGFLFPHAAMQQLFRGIFLVELTRLGLPLDRNQRLQLRSARKRAAQKNWVVFIEAPDERDPQHLVKYLARYVYQTAISDHRIVAVNEGGVMLRTRGTATITLPGIEFVRCLAMHFRPKRLKTVRSYGLLAPGARPDLRRARELIGNLSPPVHQDKADPHDDDGDGDGGNRRCPMCNHPLTVHTIPSDPTFPYYARGPP